MCYHLILIWSKIRASIPSVYRHNLYVLQILQHFNNHNLKQFLSFRCRFVGSSLSALTIQINSTQNTKNGTETYSIYSQIPRKELPHQLSQNQYDMIGRNNKFQVSKDSTYKKWLTTNFTSQMNWVPSSFQSQQLQIIPRKPCNQSSQNFILSNVVWNL